MIFCRLAKLGFSQEQVLDFTPRYTRACLADPEAIQSEDANLKEAEIRSRLKYYEGTRHLARKFQKDLDAHIAKTGSNQKQIDDLRKQRIKNRIAERISNG